MKKIILTICFLVMAQFIAQAVFADEIIDSKGNITPCKIVTVSEGLIEYEIDGCLYTIHRIGNQPIFNDYIDVKTAIFKKENTTRYTGRVIIRDYSGATIRTPDRDMQIPWYQIKFVGMYNPN